LDEGAELNVQENGGAAPGCRGTGTPQRAR
jgi:hypothetical protein